MGISKSTPLINQHLSGCNFVECTFENCDLSNAQLGNTAFREVNFKECKMLGLHFEHCNDLIFSVHFNDCQLDFSPGALRLIAEKAQERETGARGLRAVMEELMLEMMYSLPSQSQVKEVVISKDVVLNKSNPLAVMEKAG